MTGSHGPRPGNQPVNSGSAGKVGLQAGQSLTTENGRAELLLAPGVLLRVDHNSSVRMDSPDLANTELTLERGRAMAEVAQTLLGRGYAVRIYDPALNLAALVGANKRVIDTRMPHLASLLCPDLPTALGKKGVVVVAQQCASVAELRKLVTKDHQVIDVNGWPELRDLPSKYDGFCW